MHLWVIDLLAHRKEREKIEFVFIWVVVSKWRRSTAHNTRSLLFLIMLNDLAITVHFRSLFIVILRASSKSSEIRCEVQKFISGFASRFVNYAFDWLVRVSGPITAFVYKLACEFWKFNELLNFATNFRTLRRSSEYYSENWPEIGCKYKHWLEISWRRLPLRNNW